MAEQLIYSRISSVMADVDAISKGRKNQQQNFNFRGIDDIYNEMHSILAKHKVFTIPEVLEERTEERTTKSGSNLIYRVLKLKYTFYCEDGSSVASVVIGEGMDSGDKAANKAMSIAHKYALLQVFCIPTEDEKDPDQRTPEVSKPNQQKQNNKQQEQDGKIVKISEAQHRLLEAEISKRQIDREAFKKYFGLKSLTDLPTLSFDEALKKIQKKPLKEGRS